VLEEVLQANFNENKANWLFNCCITTSCALCITQSLEKN
jgi:hypothetical protein